MSNEIKENNSVMKCCICNNENIGEFIVIEDKKYHLNCITNLQEENKQLKELNVCVGCNNNPDYKSRNEKYKKVINEIKEKIDDYFGYDYKNESQARLDTINEINHIIVDLYNGGDEE